MSRKSPLFVLFITIFIDLLGFGIIIPVLPNFAKSLGASGFIVTVIAGIYSFFQLYASSIFFSYKYKHIFRNRLHIIQDLF